MNQPVQNTTGKVAIRFVIGLLFVLGTYAFLSLTSDQTKQTQANHAHSDPRLQDTPQTDPGDDSVSPQTDPSSQASGSDSARHSPAGENAQTPFVGSWTLQDSFVNASGGNTQTSTTCSYLINADQTGTFHMDWLSGKPITAHFTWRNEKSSLTLTFETITGDQFFEWTGRHAHLTWTVSADGQQLTLSGEDIRSSALVSLGRGTGLTNMDGSPSTATPPTFTGTIDPAVYHRR